MTLRLSHKKRPPFLFSHRARVNQLVCDPRPYVRAWAEDGRPLWAPCLAWSPGPVTLASTGDGSYGTLFGANWLAQICQDGTWVLYKRIDTDTLEVTEWDVVPPTVAITARHPTLCFDQAARPAIAWEDAEGIRLREFNEVTGLYHFIGPFPGVDPVLLMDAAVNRNVTDSDVVLWFLSEDRKALQYRIQAENFAVLHEHHTFSNQVVLDAVDTGRYRFQLKYGNEHGAVIPTGGSFYALVSDLYPIFHQDGVELDGDAVTGVYERGAWSANPVEPVLVTADAIPGEYASPISRYGAVEAALEAASEALTGSYELGVSRYEYAEAAVDVTGEALEGEYERAVIRVSQSEASLAVTATTLEGAYAAA